MKNFIIFLCGGLTVGSLFVFTAYTGGIDSNKTNSKLIDADRPQDIETGEPVQNIRVPKIPKQIDLAGEPMPMDNPDAIERFDREFLSICFSHGTTFNTIKLSEKYFPIIEPILKKNEVPDDFKYLAVTESNLRNATSPAGAKGIWQFMPETAREYGMEVSTEVDERYDLEKSTEAACAYLKKAYKEFNSWTLAAASYNMGGGRLKGHIEFQGSRDYFELVMNQETSRYVPRILAHKYIFRKPSSFGLWVEESDLYEPFPAYRVVEVSSSIPNLATFARENGVSYRALKIHNPWLIDEKLTNKAKKTYRIKIPVS